MAAAITTQLVTDPAAAEEMETSERHKPADDSAPGGVVGTDDEALEIVDRYIETIFDEVYKAKPAMCCGMRWYVVRCIFFTTLTSCLLGYDIGIWGAAKLQVRDRFELTAVQVEVLIGSLNLCAAFGGLGSGQLSESYGRRTTIGLACCMFIFGSFFKCAAMSYASLMVGRTVTGVGVGVGLAIAPLYGAELAPKSIRGGLVTLTEISINIGILLGYVIGWALSGLDDDTGWRVMLAFGAFPPVVILVALIWMPESPRWLVNNHREADAARVLASSSDRDEANAAITDLRALTSATDASTDTASWSELWSEVRNRESTTRHLLLAGIGVAFMQQASGIEAQVYYTPEILESAGMESDNQKLGGQVLVGVVKVAFIFFPLLTLDSKRSWLGRRALLMASALGMTLAQGLLAINFIPGDSSVALSLTGQCLYMAFFSLGYGPITWVYTSEVFPLRFRGKAMGVATFTNRVTSGIIAMSFYSMTEGMTISGTFVFFAVFAFISFLFAWIYVPETKGKSLEEIEGSLAPRDKGKSKGKGKGGHRNGSKGPEGSKHTSLENMACATVENDARSPS